MGVFNAIITADPFRPSPTTPIPLTNFQESNLYISVCSSKPYEGGLANIPKNKYGFPKRYSFQPSFRLVCSRVEKRERDEDRWRVRRSKEGECRTTVEKLYLNLLRPVCSSVCASARALRVIPECCTMPAAYWVIVRRAWNLTRELFESLALRFRNEQSGKDTQEHEEGKDLHDVVEPR